MTIFRSVSGPRPCCTPPIGASATGRYFVTGVAVATGCEGGGVGRRVVSGAGAATDRGGAGVGWRDCVGSAIWAVDGAGVGVRRRGCGGRAVGKASGAGTLMVCRVAGVGRGVGLGFTSGPVVGL